MKKTILITGGFGYIGSNIGAKLSKKYNIVLFDTKIPKWAKNDMKKISGNVLNIKDCIKATENVNYIIHCAAITDKKCELDVKKTLAINSEGTYNMLKAAEKNKVEKLIYLSTFHVYGHQDVNIISEKNITNPLSIYGISHRLAESYCEMIASNSELKTVILRLSNIYGAPINRFINRWNLVPNAMCKQAFENQKIIIFGDGKQERDFLSINNLLKSIELIIPRNNNYELFNVGEGEKLSIKQLANKIKLSYEKKYKKN
ncbi:MAG: SDR family oxidoreductase, partial [Nanoarchaeota archaeon]|nr:SDR family oxidoreductase [Nanoarchaeota archaeon]